MSVRSAGTLKLNYGKTLDYEIAITQQQYKNTKDALHTILIYFDDPEQYKQRLQRLIGAPNRLLSQLDRIYGRLMELLTEQYLRSDQRKISLDSHRGIMETQATDHERHMAEMKDRLGLFHSLDKVTSGTLTHLNNFHNAVARWDWQKQRGH